MSSFCTALGAMFVSTKCRHLPKQPPNTWSDCGFLSFCVTFVGRRLYRSFSIGFALSSGAKANLQFSMRCPSKPRARSSQSQSACSVPLMLLCPLESAAPRKYENTTSCVVLHTSLLPGRAKNLPNSPPACARVIAIISALWATMLPRHVEDRKRISSSVASVSPPIRLIYTK